MGSQLCTLTLTYVLTYLPHSAPGYIRQSAAIKSWIARRSVVSHCVGQFCAQLLDLLVSCLSSITVTRSDTSKLDIYLATPVDISLDPISGTK